MSFLTYVHRVNPMIELNNKNPRLVFLDFGLGVADFKVFPQIRIRHGQISPGSNFEVNWLEENIRIS